MSALLKMPSLERKAERPGWGIMDLEISVRRQKQEDEEQIQQ